jgi:hypothetical protein
VCNQFINFFRQETERAAEKTARGKCEKEGKRKGAQQVNKKLQNDMHDIIKLGFI